MSTPLVYDNHEWFLAITRNMSFWHQHFSNVGHYHHLSKFGIDAKMLILYVTEGGTQTHCFLTNPNYGEYAKAVMRSVDSEEKIQALKTAYVGHAKTLLEALAKADSDLNQQTLKQFFDAYAVFAAGLMVTATIGRTGADDLTVNLAKLGYKDEEIPLMNGTITYPEEHTPLFNSQLSLLEIGVGVQRGALTEAGIEIELGKWLEKFGYIPVNFCENPWTLADAKNQLASFLTKDCKSEYEKAKASHIEKVAGANKMLAKIANPEITVLAHAVAEGTYLNEFRKNIFSQVSLGYRGIFAKIAALGGSKNWRDCFYVLPDEMLSLLGGEKIDITKLVSERAVAGIYTDDSGKNHLLAQGELAPFHEFLKQTHGAKQASDKAGVGATPTAITQIKGMPASKGFVKGIARIILSSKDFDRLNPGEILVTTMTSVDFVPVMERASAFITNEGGITSHASIVAREMNKPCIIGTKNATQLIKDGDMVEVDAAKGIVRIIS